MRALILYTAMAGLLATVPGCASKRLHTRSIDATMILPAGAERTQLKPGQTFLMPVPIDSPSPRFPENVKPSSAVVCVEIEVSGEGVVGAVRQIAPSPDCAAPGTDASTVFVPAVSEAVRSWTYFAAALCEYETDEMQCEQGTARLTPVAVKLAYRFQFSQANGTRGVSSEPLH